MAKHLVQKGHQVTMVFGESPRLKSPLHGQSYRKGIRRGTYLGINLIELNLSYNNKMSLFKRSMVFIQFSLKSIHLVFKEDFDLVFATSTPITAGIPGIVMRMFGKKKPFVFEVRDLWPELPREMGIVKNRFLLWLMGVLEYFSYNKADSCIALSPGIQQGIKKRLAKDKAVYLIPNGCDLDLFKPGMHTKQIFAGCDDQHFVAIFIGAHGIANGLDAALDAAAVLKNDPRAEQIKIVLIGDGKLKERLKKRVHQEQLNNVVLLDPVPKKELQDYLWAADVGLMLLANVPAFYYGTSPNKFFDYISSGLPVLNNYPGWLAEMIDNHNLGVVSQPDNANEFADALIRLSRDKDSMQKMKVNTRNFAESSFNRKELATDFEKALVSTYTHFNTHSKC